ncbi:MAG: TIGR04283 family arsenosugar biosynthesis glycosyltransferase [Balneolaceae bacterium]|nr:TIGR04283 family arsenosugar biosynthesis glycosyltransferase [Balneolaceae bacterium]
MKISVIIPTLNEQDVIQETVETVLRHATGNLREIIVVDGGSSDHTRRRAAQAGATRVICTDESARARQMNTGAESASAGILYFLHADTLPPEAFDRMILEACRQDYPAGCFQLGFDSDHPMLRFYGWCTRFDLDTFRFGDQSLFITRKLFNNLGGFDDRLMVMEDNMMVRAIKKRSAFKILPERVITSSRKYHRVGVVKLQLVFILIYTLFFLGVPQQTLVRTYKKLIT